MTRHGIENQAVAGMSPSRPLIQIIRAVRRFKRGAMGLDELGRWLILTVSRNTAGSYLGYGVKRGPRSGASAI